MSDGGRARARPGAKVSHELWRTIDDEDSGGRVTPEDSFYTRPFIGAEDEARETVTIGVIGAGRRMTPLLSRMMEYEYVDVRMVVDANPLAPGIMIAQSLGVPTSSDVRDIFAILGSIDFLFCVNDDVDLRDRVIKEFRATDNRRTIFFNELASRFITSLTKDARHLMHLVPPPLPRGERDGFEAD